MFRLVPSLPPSLPSFQFMSTFWCKYGFNVRTFLWSYQCSNDACKCRTSYVQNRTERGWETESNVDYLWIFPLSAALIAEVWNLPSRAKQYRLAPLCVLAIFRNIVWRCITLPYGLMVYTLVRRSVYVVYLWVLCVLFHALSIYLSMGNYMVNILRPLYMLG